MPDADGRATWDEVWMANADALGGRSRCDRAGVGCVLVSSAQSQLAASYNGPPPGFKVEGRCTTWCPRARGETALGSNYDACPSVHAEVNAIARAARPDLIGGTAYVTRASCVGCAKALAAAGIARLVHRVGDIDAHRRPELTEMFLRRCGLTVTRWA